MLKKMEELIVGLNSPHIFTSFVHSSGHGFESVWRNYF